MNSAIQFEDRASSSRGKHDGESSSLLCDRLSRTRDSSPRQLPTDHDYAVPTREYQTDQSSLNPAPTAACPVLEKRNEQRQKQPHKCEAVDGVTPYQECFCSLLHRWDFSHSSNEPSNLEHFLDTPHTLHVERINVRSPSTTILFVKLDSDFDWCDDIAREFLEAMPLGNKSKHTPAATSVTRITHNGANFLARSMDAVQFSLTLFSTG